MGRLLALAGLLWLQVSAPPAGFSGAVITRAVRPGDSLWAIAARYGLPPATLAADNGLSPTDTLTPGQRLVIDNRHVLPSHPADGIVVNVPQRMLFVFARGRLAVAYPIAVGRVKWPTPRGHFEVSSRRVDPTWSVPKSIQAEAAAAGRPVRAKVPPGPANPLGDRWIGVSKLGFGIHGTNQPLSIYRFATHGCIRLHPADARALFDLVTVGTPIDIVYQPVLAAIVDPQHVMVEVHPDLYHQVAAPRVELERRLEALDAAVERRLVAEAVRRQSGRGVVIERTETAAQMSTR